MAKRRSKKKSKRSKRVKKKSARKAAPRVASSSSGSSASKTWAFLTFLLPVVGFILALLFRRKDKYAMYYGKQSLVWVLAWVLISFGLGLTIIGAPLILIWDIIVLVLWVLGLLYSVSGKMKPLPIIGRFGEKLKL